MKLPPLAITYYGQMRADVRQKTQNFLWWTAETLLGSFISSDNGIRIRFIRTFDEEGKAAIGGRWRLVSAHATRVAQ